MHVYVCGHMLSFILLCAHACTRVPAYAFHGTLVEDRGQLAGISSLSTMWVMGIELGLSDLYLYLLSYLMGPPCFSETRSLIGLQPTK